MKGATPVLRGGVIASCTLLVVGLLLRSDAVTRAGLILLTLTPCALLVVVTVHFVRHRDATFAAISIGVLFLLLLSLTLASR